MSNKALIKAVLFQHDGELKKPEGIRIYRCNPRSHPLARLTCQSVSPTRRRNNRVGIISTSYSSLAQKVSLIVPIKARILSSPIR